jgi:hypothetical protein
MPDFALIAAVLSFGWLAFQIESARGENPDAGAHGKRLQKIRR